MAGQRSHFSWVARFKKSKSENRSKRIDAKQTAAITPVIIEVKSGTESKLCNLLFEKLVRVLGMNHFAFCEFDRHAKLINGYVLRATTHQIHLDTARLFIINGLRSEEHTSELQSRFGISYAV